MPFLSFLSELPPGISRLILAVGVVGMAGGSNEAVELVVGRSRR